MNLATPALKNSAEDREYTFTDTDFKAIAKLANSRYGLFLQDSKKALVYSRLARRLRTLGLNNFEEYCKLLVSEKGQGEQQFLLSALTTNVTHFFRERHHFEELRNNLLPKLVAQVCGRSARHHAT